MPVFIIGKEVETTESKIEVELLSVGTHTFRLVVVDDSGNMSLPVDLDVLVRDEQRPTAKLTAIPNPVDFGNSLTLDGSGSFDVGGRVVKYIWTLVK